MSRSLSTLAVIMLTLVGMSAHAQDSSPPPAPAKEEAKAAPEKPEVKKDAAEATPTAPANADEADKAADAPKGDDGVAADAPKEATGEREAAGTEPVEAPAEEEVELAPLAVSLFELAVAEDASRAWLQEATKVEMAIGGQLRSLEGVTVSGRALEPLAEGCLSDAACRAEAALKSQAAANVAGRLSGGGEKPLVLEVVVFGKAGVELHAAKVEAASADALVADAVDGVMKGVSDALAKLPREKADGKEDQDGPRRFWSEDEGEDGAETEEAAPRLDAKASPPPQAEEPESTTPPYAAWAWTGGFVAGGASLAMVGVGWDLFSPTSVDDGLDAFDFIGPSLVVTGAVVALAGLIFNPFAEEESDD